MAVAATSKRQRLARAGMPASAFVRGVSAATGRGRKRRYPGSQVLLGRLGLGRLGNVAGHLCLAGLELLDTGFELLDLLPHRCKIARHRLH